MVVVTVSVSAQPTENASRAVNKKVSNLFIKKLELFELCGLKIKLHVKQKAICYT